ncbi:myocyte-specific enhancer factor 2A-like protein [Lates japonicus]|uniref:Myocyte-specific enhancer factor 2A-like protein n=1 Tax=Lates japonicus TaxID=270547 RepID=A0AAD3MIV1_LATJO|nr:myocyte-specific enhancer factor 2A-like protein [Lates japonicus]
MANHLWLNKLFNAPTPTWTKVLQKYTGTEPRKQDSSDIVEALNKKEHRGCDSPDAEASYVLTPNTEEKYKKINEEFDNMMKSHKIVAYKGASDLALQNGSGSAHLVETVWEDHPTKSPPLIFHLHQGTAWSLPAQGRPPVVIPQSKE